MVFCYECHEELLHNPVLLPADIARFAGLVKLSGLDENIKPEHKRLISGRIELLHRVLELGIRSLESELHNPTEEE